MKEANETGMLNDWLLAFVCSCHSDAGTMDANKEAGPRSAFAVACGLFVIWGVALGLYYSCFFQFTHVFAFRPIHIGLIFALFHVAYFVLAVPAALFHRQYGFKLGFLFGLSAFALGAFLLYLAIIQHSSGYFLVAVVTMGTSGAWLDTSLNPLAVEAGNPQTSVVRLNIAQLFNGWGLFAGYFVAIMIFEKHYDLSAGTAAQSSAHPYVLVGLGAILLAFLVEQISLPSFATRRKDGAADLRTEARSLLGDKVFLTAAAALCACCMVLTILWSANYRYHVNELPGHAVALFERGSFWFAIGRLLGCALMRWIDPVRLLPWSAGFCLIATVIAAAAGGVTGWVCLLSATVFLSVLYPTVLGSALSRHMGRLKLAAGVLMAAAGIGSALASLGANIALEVLYIDPRVVVAFAWPCLAVVLVYSHLSNAGRSSTGLTQPAVQDCTPAATR